MEHETEKYQETLRAIKQDFFRFRNGIVAEGLKGITGNAKRIYGLTVPQFMEMSKKYSKDTELGLLLWQDEGTRESRIFALYLIDPNDIDLKHANRLISDVQSFEEGDFLAFKVLRNIPEAEKVYKELSNSNEEFDGWSSHCLEMFRKNLEIK